MKLFLMRHAQAEEAKAKDDKLRLLTEVGKKEASVAADFLKQYHIDKILVSSAMRTRQTSEIIQDKIKCSKYEILPELYASSAEKIVEIIAKQENSAKILLVIAHNPGILRVALQLLDSDSLEYDELLDGGMPTAKIVTLDFPAMVSWKDIVAK